MKRASYQNGSVVLRERKKGPDVWVFRYYEDGKQKSKFIGSVKELRTKASAEKKIAAFRDEINDRAQGLSIAALCDRFEKAELDIRPRTAGTYKFILKRIKNDFGKQRIEDVAKDLPALEAWLNGLQRAKGGEMSKKSKLHIKALLHLLYEFAMKHGLFPLSRNPIQLIQIRGQHKKVRQHTILTADDYEKLLAELEAIGAPECVGTMVQVARFSGLRSCEIAGLRWDAIDFENRTIAIRVSSVGKSQGAPKTDASEAEMPMDNELERVLHVWKESQTAPDGSSLSVNGWLFGNLDTGRPYWPESLQKKYLKPAGKKLGVKSLGWHDFRHTFRAHMGEAGIAIESQQRLMRHSDPGMALKYGRGKLSQQMRTDHGKVVEMLKPRRMA